jgi:hypothetical protein
MTKWLVAGESQENPIIPQTLLRASEEEADEAYLAWICAAIMPWADAPRIPPPKKSKQPLHAAYLVVQEGLKTPNRVGDVITASLDHNEAISQLVGECQNRLAKEDPKALVHRSKVGMLLRKWGRTWRSQVFFSMLHEIVYGSRSTSGTYDPPIVLCYPKTFACANRFRTFQASINHDQMYSISMPTFSKQL